MGYRSEVMALVYTYNQPLKYQALKTLMNTTFKEVLEEWGNDFDWVESHNALRFRAEDVKWYESYIEVRRFHAFLAEVERLGYSTEFIRVGEESGDIDSQESNGGCGYLSTQTTIVCDL